jgi:hypothetical protein
MNNIINLNKIKLEIVNYRFSEMSDPFKCCRDQEWKQCKEKTYILNLEGFCISHRIEVIGYKLFLIRSYFFVFNGL